MPGEWREATIEEVAERVAMGPFGSSIKVETFVPSGVPVISGQHLHGSKVDDRVGFNFVSEEHADRLKNANVQRGDVIFTHAGNIGQVAFVPETSQFERYVISQRQFYMRCDPTKVLPEFVVAYFKTPQGQHQLLANTSQVGVPSIAQPVTYLRTIEIPLPPVREQRAIADILGTLDDKIGLNRRMNETLEAMARALFKSWFVDFDPVRAKAQGLAPRLPGNLVDLFAESFEESELGEIPAGWNVVTVADVAEINARTLGSADSLHVIDYIEISEVMRGEVTNIVRYERGTEPSRARRRLQHGDTVLSSVRPDRGAQFLCWNPPETLIASTGFAVLSSRDGNWAFLYSAMTRREIGEDLGRLADGGAYPAIGPEVISGLRLIVPTDPGLPVAYQKLAGPLYEQSANHRVESRTLAMIRDALLPKLISGELRIPDAERIIGRCV